MLSNRRLLSHSNTWPLFKNKTARASSRLQALDTLVLLMGGSSLAAICEQLQRHGKPADTPVALVHAATLDSQRVWRGTLGGIAEQTEGERLSPCIIVVGQVASLGL